MMRGDFARDVYTAPPRGGYSLECGGRRDMRDVPVLGGFLGDLQIGRASCRERV